MTDPEITFPLTIIDGFASIRARVGDTSGQLMFDTGTRNALVLNDHLLQKLGPGSSEGQGHVSSGQSYQVTIGDCVKDVHIPTDTIARAVPSVESNDVAFIEKDITPDFLGFFGFEAYPGYAFKLDYLRKELVLSRSFIDGRSSLPQGETVLGTLPFTTRRRSNDPFVHVMIGRRGFVGILDTDQKGTLEMTQSMKDAMLQEGALQLLTEKDDDEILYRGQIQLAPGLTVTLPGLPIHAPGSRADAGIGVTEPAVIYLGFQFLSQFKTIWGYPHQMIYLLRP